MKNDSPIRDASRAVLALVWTLLVVVWGCGDSPTVSDSNTNWLMACESDRQCEGSLTCVCGLCTEACVNDDACVAAGAGARCVSTVTGAAAQRCAARGHGDVTQICAVTCEGTNVCSDSEQMCVENLCQAPRSPATDAGDARMPDAGSGDSAIDGSTQLTCAPGPCQNGGRCSTDGTACTCPAGIGGATCDQIAPVRQLVVGLHHSCVLLADNAIKCWGDNAAGQLGQGDTAARGDGPNELGANLPPIDLGTSVEIDSITAGTAHTCALFVDGAIKCWGRNSNGELGLGDTDNRGDGAGELGAALPFVPLAGHLAREVSAGDTHTCARFADGRVACWGSNLNGQLGIDSVSPRGTSPDQLGDNLLFAQLGADALARQVVASAGYSCAVFEDDTVKCWGRNLNGQLGQGDDVNRGDAVGEMATLAPIALGDVSNGVASIESHGAHVCVLVGGAVRCWGFGGVGQLGVGDTATRGDQAGEMGSSLPDARLGAAAVRVSAGAAQTCAVLMGNVVKCWGQNSAGQLGVGDVAPRGDDATEVDAMLPPVMLPTGTITSVATGGFHTCVLIDGASVYCFGENALGELGRGTIDRIGDELSEIPIGPPAVAF